MAKRIWTRHAGLAATIFGMISASIYLLMINVTLAHIEAVSGLAPLDMRPFGYDPADVAKLLNGLGVEGRKYYLGRQLPLDTLYPIMLAMTLITVNCWFRQYMPNSRLIRLGIIFAFAMALFDYAENLGIMVMLLNWPAQPALLVFATSTATIFKSALTTMAVVMVCLTGIVWLRLSKTFIH